MKVGEVATFPNPSRNKEQAVKIMEEAAEVFAAWMACDDAYEAGLSAFDKWLIRDLEDECADLITAVCNLLAAFDIEDMNQAMERCKERNIARKRM